MKDWEELVIGLIEDLGCYIEWLDDFRHSDNVPTEVNQKIIIEQKIVRTMIKRLRAHNVAENNPNLERLMHWDHRFNNPN